ncbi:MAG: protein translocase subunit SecF [Treponema sp.]|nr:protein translocase subunit SecF [Treponema sp.]
MKKVINFSKAFLPCSILSAVLILSGIVRVAVTGINFGIDFKPGLIEEVRIAPTVLELSYSGSARVTIDAAESGIDIVITGSGAENRTETFSYASNSTVADLAANMAKIEGLSVHSVVPGNTPAAGLFVNSAVGNVITENKFRVYGSTDSSISIDDVRSATSTVKGVAVKALGSEENRSYQIRVADSGEPGSSKILQETIIKTLEGKFGADKVAVVKTDFIGSQFSKSLVGQSVVLVLATLFLIWLYAAIRFHWDFAFGSVLAVIHDALIMISFIAWIQMEFTTTTLAAVLTIIGYSINATVVILDRIRANMKLIDTKKFNDIINVSLTDTLSRSIITTVTTLFAVVSLYAFTTGSIKDFALALIAGLISGCYSSIYINGAFISFMRRKWTPESGIHHSLPKAKKMQIDADADLK